MRHLLRVSAVTVVLVLAMWTTSRVGAQARVTLFEGARVILADGRTLENAVFTVTGNQIGQVGRMGEIGVPPGATRVSLTGKTVMPAIIDTHTHLSRTRDMLLDDLRQRAYYGVSAALSLGQDTGDLPFQIRSESETMPNAARFRTAA